MELTNDSKNAHSHEGKKASVATDNVAPLNKTPVKIILDDMELNEDQLDIISGGGELPPPKVVG